MYDGVTAQHLDEIHVLYRGRLPDRLLPDATGFDNLWNLHPDDYHEIVIHGRKVKTPRWQQAFGKDYHYTRSTNTALPIPDALQPFTAWATGEIDARLNGLLLNWYDGALGHYIGAHRDSTTNMIKGAPIVTISLGETRVFRLRQWKGKTTLDFAAENGAVFVMPYDTNQAWTHAVPQAKRFRGRRISVTLRAFR